MYEKHSYKTYTYRLIIESTKVFKTEKIIFQPQYSKCLLEYF